MKRTWTFISLACLKFIDYRLISLIKIEVLKPIKNYLCKQRWSQPSFFINLLFLLKWAAAHLCPLSGVRFREQEAVRHPGAASTCCHLAVWSLAKHLLQTFLLTSLLPHGIIGRLAEGVGCVQNAGFSPRAGPVGSLAPQSSSVFSSVWTHIYCLFPVFSHHNYMKTILEHLSDNYFASP